MSALDGPRSIVLAGAGRMGGALLRGWMRNGMAPSTVTVVDPNPDAVTAAFCERSGIAIRRPDTPPDVLVLAVKPQTFANAPSAFAALVRPDTLVISILAGVTLSGLRAALPDAGSIVRAMPNLPASVGCGASGAAAEATITPMRRSLAQRLLAAVSEVEWLDEALIDAVTAVSGSGPAYVFLLTECLATAARAAGLPDDVAQRLARRTVEGAGALMTAEPDRSASDLRTAVTSPGGTTAAALAVLQERDGLEALLVRAVAAAARRSGELAR